MFDIIDGGVPAVFLDGPKQGHVGVADNQRGDGPPRSLLFLGDRLVYLRAGKQKIEIMDHTTGRPKRVRGVGYRVDPECAFMLEVKREVAAAAAERDAGRIETI